MNTVDLAVEAAADVLAFAPAAFAEQTGYKVKTIAAIGEAGDPCALETAEALASKFGATIAERASSDVDLVVVGSKPGTVTGRVTISAAAEYLIELSSCPVIVVPRGVTVRFDS
jgi:nucleotide-binding universal stress UspA family protein